MERVALPLLVVLAIGILLASIFSFLMIRKQVKSELYGSTLKYNLLSVSYTFLISFFLIAYCVYLAFLIVVPAYEPITFLLTFLLFFGSVFVGSSVVVINNSIGVVMGMKLNEFDTMTGLMTKNCFEMTAQRILDEGTGPYTLVVVDMDQFKAINDIHGHRKGDEVIKGSADIIRKAVRAGDLVGRFGGDEFLILLRATKANQADAIMSRVEKAVVQLQKKENCSVCGGISYGAANLEGGGKQSYRDVFEQADRALYEMKMAKRPKDHCPQELRQHSAV